MLSKPIYVAYSQLYLATQQITTFSTNPNWEKCVQI
jgi:hypothetical protein